MSWRRLLVPVIVVLASGTIAGIAGSAPAPTSDDVTAGEPDAAARPPETTEGSNRSGAAPLPLQLQGEEGEEGEEGTPGGSIARFHGDDDIACALPDGAAELTGNWTHGMYVSAWSATEDPVMIRAAAHSPCGKPAHAAFRGRFGTRGDFMPPGLAKKAERPEAGS